MAREHIFVDKTEIVLLVLMGNREANVNLSADKITNITIEKFTEKSLFGSKESERIVIKPNNAPNSFIFTKKTEKEHFEGNKQALIKFAKDNRVSLTVNV